MLEADHSDTVVTLTIGGVEHEFGKFRPKEALQALQRANDRAQRRAMEIVSTGSVKERVEVFRRTMAVYSMDNLNDLLSDGDFLMDVMYLCYKRKHPEATSEQFADLFDMLDLSMMSVYVDKLSGLAPEDEENPTLQAAGATTGQDGTS